jgi:hypothetical protein
LLNGEEGRKRDLETVYGQARRGLVEIWTSTIAIVEVNRLASEMNVPRPVSGEGLPVIDDLLFQPFVNPVSMDTLVARLARQLLRETVGLTKRPDAMHLASAIHWNIPLFHTYDGSDLLHLDGKIQCRDGTSMEICLPRDPFDGGMFSERPENAN